MIRTSIRPTDGTRRRSLRGRAAVGLATATTAVLLLAGCAGSSTPEDRALDDLQQRTLSVTQSSADGDYAKALAQLEELRTAVEADLAEGSIDQARRDEVIARIDAVRAQLEAARDAAETTPTPSPSPSASPSPCARGTATADPATGTAVGTASAEPATPGTGTGTGTADLAVRIAIRPALRRVGDRGDRRASDDRRGRRSGRRSARAGQTPSTRSASARAQRSASASDSRVRGPDAGSWASTTRRMVSTMSRNPARPEWNACTACSFAAL